MRIFFKNLVIFYRTFLSPILRALGGRCRFFPSCSKYALECLEKMPLPQALLRIARRLFSCHPFHPGGIDPVAGVGRGS